MSFGSDPQHWKVWLVDQVTVVERQGVGSRMNMRLPGTAVRGRTFSDSDVGASSMTAAVASAFTFLAGVWLMLSPFTLDHRLTGGGFNGYWNDVFAGIALIGLGSVPLVEPGAGPLWISLRPVVGTWLLIAPFVLDYNTGAPAPDSTVNDVVVGAVVLILWLVSARRPEQVQRRLRGDRERESV